MIRYITVDDMDGLISGVVTRKLEVHGDSRGMLVETLRIDWPDLFDHKMRPFAQSYYSVTRPGIARDEDRWHVHRKQEDRVVVLFGDIVLALYDWRADSPTNGRLNLFKMGESQGPLKQFAILIPKNVLHAFVVVSKVPAVLLNYPTRLYDPGDEGRVPFQEVAVRFENGDLFSWDIVRQDVLRP